MDYNQFAESIKQKYPQYANVDNLTLSKKMVEKYPQYASKVTFEQPKKTSLGQKILNTGTDVANFFGAKGISEQFGADIARSQANTQQEKNMVDYPSMREVVGSAIQTGANLIPGAGEGAGLLGKAAVGAGTGLAFDVGSKLQNEDKTIGQALTPGINTAIGAVLPVASTLLGNATEKGAQKLAKNLEESNLRLTPKDRSFIDRTNPDFTTWLAEKKITGNPEQRYQKIESIYNATENKVQDVLKQGNKTISKDEFIKSVANIPENFIDDPQLYDASQNMVDKLIKTAQEKYGNEIPLTFVNDVKRNYGKRAFDKAAQQVTNESSYQISQSLYDLLQEKAPELKPLNDEYSKVILARKLMDKAMGRSQLGIVGKIASSAVGGSVGASFGGPVGTGIGIVAGNTVAGNLLGTKTRSNIGALAQKLTEQMSKPAKNGKYNISKKLLMNLLSQIQSNSM